MNNKNWYPENLRVGANGTEATVEFLKEIYNPTQHFSYAEFGIYKADTARQVCENFPNANLYLFDFENAVNAAQSKLSKFSNKIFTMAIPKNRTTVTIGVWVNCIWSAMPLQFSTIVF